MKRKKLVAVAAVMAAVAAVATAGTTSSASAKTRSATVGDTIKVAGVGNKQLYSTAVAGAQARFKIANDSKELPGGRKIEFVEFADDKASADTNLAETRRLIDQEGVFALVPVLTPVDQGATYANQKHVPTIGWGISAQYCDPSITYAFAFSGCLVPPEPIKYAGNTWGQMINKQLEAQGKNPKGATAAVIVEDNASGRSGLEVIAGTAEASGQKVVYKKASLPPLPTVVSDYTPYVQDIMTSNNGQPPDVVYLVLTFTNVAGLGKALTQAGYKGIQTNAVGYDPALTSLANGWSVFTQFATPEAAAEGNKEMQKIVDAIHGQGLQNIGQPALAGYFSADFFVQALKKAGKNLTPEAFQKAAAKLNYSIPKTVGPTIYPTAFFASTPCGQLTQSDGTKYNIVVAYDCYDLITPTKNGGWKTIPYSKAKRP